MGTKYPSQSASGYNSSPPSDDGSTTSDNKVTWATHKAKLGDPVKNLADAINTALVTALDVSVVVTSTNLTTDASHHLKPIVCTSAVTISLCDATTAAVGYQVTVVNASSGLVTVTPVTGTDTLNGTAGGSIVLQKNASATFETLASHVGYVALSSFEPEEEGSWTPTIVGTSGGPLSFATQIGRYIRKGNLVTLWGRVTCNGGSVIAGDTSITGVPFAPTSNVLAAIHFSYWSSTTLSANYTHLGGFIANAGTSILMYQNGSGQTTIALPGGTVGSAADWIFSGSYRIN